MRITERGLHTRGMTQQQLSCDFNEKIERSEDEQIENSHRFATVDPSAQSPLFSSAHFR